MRKHIHNIHVFIPKPAGSFYFSQNLTGVHFLLTVFLARNPKAKEMLSKHLLTQAAASSQHLYRAYPRLKDTCLVFSILGGLSLSDITYTFRDNCDYCLGSVGDVGPLCDSLRIYMCLCVHTYVHTHTHTGLSSVEQLAGDCQCLQWD